MGGRGVWVVQIDMLQGEKDTLEKSVYQVSGELGQVKVELSMLKVRPPSPTPHAHRVQAVWLH